MILKERIREHFISKPYDYKFEWGKEKEKWGEKFETIKSLAKLLRCPYTSLYIPVKQLRDEGFLVYDQKLISKEEKLNP